MNAFQSFDLGAMLAPYAARQQQNAFAMQEQPARNAFGSNPAPVGLRSSGDIADSLARTESGGRYDVVNEYGYSGKYQFGQDRLDDFNRAAGARFTTADLVSNPDLQEQVFAWHIADIDDFIRRNGLDRSGYSMNAMRAVAHLGGKGGLKRFVESGGRHNPADAYGTSLADYARIHG